MIMKNKFLIFTFAFVLLQSVNLMSDQENSSESNKDSTSIPVEIEVNTTALNLSDSQKEEIKKIDQKYNSFSVVRSRFIQKDSIGNTATGWFVLQKPGKMRIEYDNIPIRFITSGSSLLYQDIKLKQKSFIPVKSTPFYYLLENDSSFLDNNILITEYEITPEYTKISFVTKENPAMGSLTLFLTNENYHIIKWNVIDAKGVLTEVFLSDPEFSTNSIKNTSIFNVQRVKEVEFDEAK